MKPLLIRHTPPRSLLHGFLVNTLNLLLVLITLLLSMRQIKRLFVRGFQKRTIVIFIRIIPVIHIKLYLLFFMPLELTFLILLVIPEILDIIRDGFVTLLRIMALITIRLIVLDLILDGFVTLLRIMALKTNRLIVLDIILDGFVIVSANIDMRERSGSHPQQIISILVRPITLRSGAYLYISYCYHFAFHNKK